MSKLIPAVAYYRMSSDRQEESIPQQRKAVKAWAARHGYTIIAEYQDAGISGNATEKREGFQAMMSAAAEGEFSAILVWDQKRFGRFDSIEAGRWVQPLQDNDIRIVLVASDRTVDLNSREGRMMFVFDTESGNEYLHSLSQQQLRGRRELAKQGKPIGAPIGYGYDRVLIDEKGGEHRVLRDERFTKPKQWQVVFKPNLEEAETVRWIFETFSGGRLTRLGMVKHLNATGVVAPGRWVKRAGELIFERKGWKGETIRRILTNPVYVGDSVRGKRGCGKYNRLAAGEIVPVKGKRKAEWYDSGLIEVRDAHEALIDRELWDAVQEKLKRIKGSAKTPGHRGTAEFSKYALNRVLFCGHCGSPMYGKKPRPIKGERSGRHIYYVCPNASKKPGNGCGHWQVREDRILPYLLEQLRKQMEWRRMKEFEPKASPNAAPSAGVEALEKQLAGLDAKIEEGAERFLTAPKELTTALASRLRAWKKERTALAERIEAARKAAADEPADYFNWYWQLFRDERSHGPLVKVAGAETDLELRPGKIIFRPSVHWDIPTVREVFRRFNARVDLYFQADKSAKQNRWELSKGIYQLGVTKGQVPTKNGAYR